MFPIKDENPTERVPITTIALIAANVLVFLWELSLPDVARQRMFFSLGLVPAWLTHGTPADAPISAPTTIFTSMFVHGGFMHLIGNMLYLWIFGNNVEDRMGRFRFLAFYLICGVAAALTQVVVAPDSRIPQVGASGAIAGVLGGYLLLYPHARVMTIIPLFFFLRVLWLPAIAVLLFWFVLQLFSGVGSMADVRHATTGGVAFFAHIGGFVAGLVLVRLFATRPPARARATSSWLS